MVTTDEEQYMTLHEAANQLHVTHNAIYLWLKDHQDVPRKRLSRMLLVRMEDLKSYRRRTPRKLAH